MSSSVSERFKAAFTGSKNVDRLPVMEWATWWTDTLQEWDKQGLPLDITNQERSQLLGLDENIQFWLAHFEPDCPKPAHHGAALITTKQDYDSFKKYLYPEDSVTKIVPQLQKAAERQKAGLAAVWFTVDGFFWFPRDLFGIEDHLYSFYDEPELYHEICEDLLAWQLRRIDELYKYVTPEFMTIAEDMSYNLGPMLSEDMFREFIMPYYKRLIPEIQKRGTKVFVDTDGNVEAMVPWLLEAGVDGVSPLERQAGTDVEEMQRKYPELLMFGGFDKMCMFKGEEAIRAEFERLLPVMKKGRYIASMDHQTPPGVTLEDYKIYVALLKEYSEKAVQE